jgi:hypothetical protein
MAKKPQIPRGCVTLRFVDTKTKQERNTVGTRDAASLYGCSMGRIRQMAIKGDIWSIETPDGRRYDADELVRLKAQRDNQRAAGKLGGQRPTGFSAC